MRIGRATILSKGIQFWWAVKWLYRLIDIRVWPSGKATVFGTVIPRFESWHPSLLNEIENAIDLARGTCGNQPLLSRVYLVFAPLLNESRGQKRDNKKGLCSQL